VIQGVGYDPDIVRGLPPGDVRFFRVAAACSLLSAIVIGVGTCYGGWLTIGPIAAAPLGAAGVLFVINLLRLHHAGSGYPLHLPIEDIERWRPAMTASLVLFLLGLLLAQPVAFLVMKPALDGRVATRLAAQRSIRAQLGVHGGRGPADGLILRAHVAWEQPLPMGALVALFGLIVASPALLRRFGAGAVRAYERERWIRERMFVDDEHAEAQDALTSMLRDVGFVGSLTLYYADPPYNTRPLVFGLDPALFVSDGIKLVRPKEVDGDAVIHAERFAYEALGAPASSPAPSPTATPPPVAPLPPAAAALGPPSADKPPAVDNEEVGAALPAWDDPAHDDVREPPAPTFFDVGRAQVKRARVHADVTAPLIARYTGRPEADVRALLRNAPDDERLHRLFPEWKRLPTILLKDAGAALDFQLAPVLALIVQRPIADVERRLRAVPRDKRLTSVFSPELARRLLRKRAAAAGR
jgi:hypothetical protein